MNETTEPSSPSLLGRMLPYFSSTPNKKTEDKRVLLTDDSAADTHPSMTSVDYLHMVSPLRDTSGRSTARRTAFSLPPAAPSDMPQSLEGTLYVRMGRSTRKSSWWRRRYVVLNFTDGGSLSCYKFHTRQPRATQVLSHLNDNVAATLGNPTDMIRSMVNRLHPRQQNPSLAEQALSLGELDGLGDEEHTPDGSDSSSLDLDFMWRIPVDLTWAVKDVQNDSTSFMVEIPTGGEGDQGQEVATAFSGSTDFKFNDSMDIDSQLGAEDGDEDGIDFSVTTSNSSLKAPVPAQIPKTLRRDFLRSRQKAKPVRIYFRCTKSGNEKALWLRAFSRVERLSHESRCRPGVISALKSPLNWTWVNSRIRSPTSQNFFRERQQLERNPLVSAEMQVENCVDKLAPKAQKHGADGEDVEFRVLPPHAYPHIWMTQKEMRAEMMLPSSRFYEIPNTSPTGALDEKPVGRLQVEVLQCLGIPKLDRTSDSDVVVYMVCGSQAFCTDVIDSRSNPMWLRKARRACIFSVYHGYARLYVGVFDDDGPHDKDDFAGRVVIDLARLRPACSYDVTLPLRQSAHVYTRRQRGAIRLRFKLDWTSERDALLSYLPKKLKIPRRVKHREDVTIPCADAKAFRNIAITVHGTHLPGRFSFQQLRATLKEVTFTQKVVFVTIKQTLKETRTWVHPAMSFFVFFAWMHCCYEGQFSLVPAYVVSYFLLHMMRNYARFGMDGAVQRGFVPPSWEELLMALLTKNREGGISPIAPLELGPNLPQLGPRSPALLEQSTATTDYKVSTHTPWGKTLFRTLGFLPREENEIDQALEDHREFPFAPSHYRRFSVTESLVPSKPRKSKNSHDKLEGVLSKVDKAAETEVADEEESDEDFQGTHSRAESRSSGFISEYDPEEDQFSPEKLKQPSRKLVRGSFNPETKQFLLEESESDALLDTSCSEYNGNGIDAVRYPEQNVDEQVTSNNNKKLTDDLAEIKDKVHDLTFHLFNDKAYVIKQRDACFFGQARRAEKREKKKKVDVSRELEKVLNIGQYSNSNPVISRVGLYVEPIIGASHSILCAFRAFYNAATWRDPMLSFWISIVGAILVVVLFIFPWRGFMFVVGVAVVGPQNFLIRIMKEKRAAASCQTTETSSDADTDETDVSVDEVEIPSDSPVFRCHLYQNDKSIPDPREVHRVVVPYSPLMYQRFYDFPPEPQYARVKPEAAAAKRHLVRLRNRRHLLYQSETFDMLNDASGDDSNGFASLLGSPGQDKRKPGVPYRRRTT